MTLDPSLLPDLHAFIVEAKAAAHVGKKPSQASSRPASHDIGYERGDWGYLDSYFGGTDFLGQETVRLKNKPVWAMNYYGRILRVDLINGQVAAYVIRPTRSKMFAENRFFGGLTHEFEGKLFVDVSSGETGSFAGYEHILISGIEVYRLDYHGGLIRD